MGIYAQLATTAVLLLLTCTVCANAGPERAALLRTGLPTEDTQLGSELSKQVASAGYQVAEIGLDELRDETRLAEFDLLVVPDGSRLPAAAMRTVDAYLRGGGDLIALKTPLWRSPLLKSNGDWVTPKEYELDKSDDPPEHVLLDFSGGSSGWMRSTNAPDIRSIYETISGGPNPGSRALHAVIPRLASWDTIGVWNSAGAFPSGDKLTVFHAKGGPNTTQLSVEWREKDGSRWIAVVPLTQEWKRFVLAPNDFRFWHSVPARAGDIFRPENAEALHIGLAFTHTTGIGHGPHEFWVGPLGTGRMTEEHQQLLEAANPPRLDTVSPEYKLFDCTDTAALKVRGDQSFGHAWRLETAVEVRSPHPRAGGGGFGKGRDWRWIPIVEAWSDKHEWRGAPVTVVTNAAGPYKDSVWASFGIGDTDWYKSEEALELIGQVAERIRRGLFIVDGGSNFYTYFEDQPVQLGVRAANTGREDANLTARVAVREAGSKVFEREWPVSVPAGGEKSVSESWLPDKWPDQGFEISAEIVVDGQVVDRVTHEAFVYKPKSEKRFMTVGGGQFLLDGKQWRMHAINYMPSSGIASEDGVYFERWLGARSYDPEVIQRDLERVRDIGFNSVSIFIYDTSTDDQNLLDLLRRLENLGLKANLSLRPGTISEFNWDRTKKIIEYYRLWENDTVIAYDLDWEPMFRDHDYRKTWDRDWEQWITERYGSVEAAELDWGCATPRDASGGVTNPLPLHFGENADLSGSRMVAAYRRFLDTLLYKKYSSWRRLVLELDPNHLVSFRMAEAGNPTLHGSWIPFDFPYLAGAVDFLAPEAYGRAGDWERVKPGWFIFEYARWAAPDKPMIWAEHGISIWDGPRKAVSPAAAEYAARSYENFYRMLIGSGAGGVAHWWYPGGYRPHEKSDYGIINPDGTDREVTKAIRKWGPEFIGGPSAKPVDHWITFDRDAHPDGISTAYDTVKEEFWKAIDSGKTPGLKTEGTGTDSTNCPLTAVGNVPYNGANPPKYLDAVFDVVEIKGRTARVTLTNLGEATWSPTPGLGGKGAVYLLAGDTKIPLPSRVQRFESVTLEVQLPQSGVTMRLEAEGRAVFGERYAVTAVDTP